MDLIALQITSSILPTLTNPKMIQQARHFPLLTDLFIIADQICFCIDKRLALCMHCDQCCVVFSNVQRPGLMSVETHYCSLKKKYHSSFMVKIIFQQDLSALHQMFFFSRQYVKIFQWIWLFLRQPEGRTFSNLYGRIRDAENPISPQVFLRVLFDCLRELQLHGITEDNHISKLKFNILLSRF